MSAARVRRAGCGGVGARGASTCPDSALRGAPAARVYESVLVRRTSGGGKVRHETLANLSALPPRRSPRSRPRCRAIVVPPRGHITALAAARARRRGARHGRVAGAARAARPGRPHGPGPGAVISRGRPASSCHPRLVVHVTLGADLGVGRRPPTTSTRRWTGWARQDAIEAAWRPAPGPGANPSRWRCSTCPSSWLEGTHCPLAARGYSRDARRALCRSSTGCSPTPRAARSRSASSPATPATRPRSPRSSRYAGEVRAGEDGHGRRPGHDHQRPHRGAEPAGTTGRPRPATGGSPRCAPPPSRS